MKFTFEAIEELEAGAKWKAFYERHEAAYRKWFLSEGDAARASYPRSRRRLERYMPELLGTYDRLVELAGGGDLAARLLSMYRPPPYLSGCSQAVWAEGERAILVRNYDYHPGLAEGAVFHTAWNGRRVIAMGDCLWGVLDGINEAGLTVSLAFGGSRAVGDGFGIPIVLRYILEFCETTADAAEALKRVPPHMAYNVTVLDRSGAFKTAYLSPEREPVLRQFPVATNHQGTLEWLEHAHATATIARERFLFSRFADISETAEGFIESFLSPPLHSNAYRRGYGTLYTAVYKPGDGSLELRWPDSTWRQSFTQFEEGTRVVQFRGRVGPPPLPGAS